jgi:tetratricopeptide (TPR) repeat protein
MKKYASSMLLLLGVAVLALGFTGCQELLPDKLQANQHIKTGNGMYTDEKYFSALQEYEKALALNPELKALYLYVGTCNSALYKPMKDDERNRNYGTHAIEYLKKAEEAFPEDDRVVYALGDMYDKLGEFEDAEKYYLKIMEKDPNDPKAYYIMADFYNKYNKSDLAKAMYEKRIALDPTAPDGYLYYASYGSDRRQWDLSIDNHEKRILAIYDQETLKYRLEITRIKDELTQIEAIKKNMDTIKNHKSLPKEEKTRLIDEAQTRLDEFKPEEELKQTLAEDEKLVEEAYATRWEKIEAQSDEIKKQLADAFYTLGVVCWNKSYQTPPHLMGAEERLLAVNKGMDACNATLRLEPDNHQAYAFIGLLWRQKIVAEPLKNDEYMAEWQKAYDKAKDLREKKFRRQKLQEQLEKMGKGE